MLGLFAESESAFISPGADSRQQGRVQPRRHFPLVSCSLRVPRPGQPGLAGNEPAVRSVNTMDAKRNYNRRSDCELIAEMEARIVD